MANIHSNLISLIGNTPLLEVHNIAQSQKLKARILVKPECFNPGGSVKDRPALTMIEEAERNGHLKPGGLIIEPTSGNTGVGLAWIATLKGYRVVLTMPESMSVERQKLLKALGAEIILTPAAEGMTGAIKRAEQLRDNTPGAIIIGQFENKANPKAHINTTAQEIWRDTDGQIDIFVATVGTGGTFSGTAKGLKQHLPSITAVAVEPAASPLLSGGKAAPHKIQGIGANFIPQNFEAEVADKIMCVTDQEAINGARLLAQKEGLLVGISSGAAISAAITLAKDEDNVGKIIVAILPDTGERYLSTELFD